MQHVKTKNFYQILQFWNLSFKHKNDHGYYSTIAITIYHGVKIFHNKNVKKAFIGK